MTEAETENVLMTQKLIVFGKEFELPTPMSDQDIRDNLVSLVKEMDAETAESLGSQNYDVRTEDGKVVVYRDAHFG